jgi:hypothetical protein
MDGARLLQCTRLIQHGTKCCGSVTRVDIANDLCAFFEVAADDKIRG